MSELSQPADASASSANTDRYALPKATREQLDERVRRLVALHFDPDTGSAFWVDRARSFAINPQRDLQSLADLARLGPLEPGDLQQQPVWNYVPRRFHNARDRFTIVQTGGTTGAGTWTAFRDDEFDAAFVRPFVTAAMHTRFPANGHWLYLGPTGPHVIGLAASRIARAMGAPTPFMVDLDPRWARKLPDGSFARRRYMDHVLTQAMAVVEGQAVDVLFATPPILVALAERMTPAQRYAIRGVHYGGMRIARSFLNRCQRELFPYAIHLSGYGNTLMGCCLELATGLDRTPSYFPHGLRLLLSVVDDNARPLPVGETGRVALTRLDESMLIVNLIERDQATLAAPPDPAPNGFSLPGLIDPQPKPSTIHHATSPVATGLY